MVKKIKKIVKKSKNSDFNQVILEYFVKKASINEISKIVNFYQIFFPNMRISFMFKKFYIYFKKHKEDYDIGKNEKFMIRMLSLLKKKHNE
jgi:hypothetical protein